MRGHRETWIFCKTSVELDRLISSRIRFAGMQTTINGAPHVEFIWKAKGDNRRHYRNEFLVHYLKMAAAELDVVFLNNTIENHKRM